jgi:hypothetical protein
MEYLRRGRGRVRRGVGHRPVGAALVRGRRSDGRRAGRLDPAASPLSVVSRSVLVVCAAERLEDELDLLRPVVRVESTVALTLLGRAILQGFLEILEQRPSVGASDAQKRVTHDVRVASHVAHVRLRCERRPGTRRTVMPN